MAFPLVKTDTLMYEYACHEGNYNMTHMLRSAHSMTADKAGTGGIRK